jgi:hypothetical protein
MVAWNRPFYSKVVLDALAKCRGISDYTVLAFVEPGCAETEKIYSEFGAAKQMVVKINRERIGISANTLQAWDAGFEQSDFIIHLEDDTVPAIDMLKMMEHCRHRYAEDMSVFSIAAHNRRMSTPRSLFGLCRREWYTCWGVGIWKSRFELARPMWSTDPTVHAYRLNECRAQHKMVEIHPALSRSQNIGAVMGVNCVRIEQNFELQYTPAWASFEDMPDGPFYDLT